MSSTVNSEDVLQATTWCWREAYENDFAARMQWTVADFVRTNHYPVVEVNGLGGTVSIVINAAVGKPVILDALRSHDPAAGQSLHYTWLHYAEAADTTINIATPTATCRLR